MPVMKPLPQEKTGASYKAATPSSSHAGARGKDSWTSGWTISWFNVSAPRVACMTITRETRSYSPNVVGHGPWVRPAQNCWKASCDEKT
jgi:hypothetical protein